MRNNTASVFFFEDMSSCLLSTIWRDPRFIHNVTHLMRSPCSRRQDALPGAPVLLCGRARHQEGHDRHAGHQGIYILKIYSGELHRVFIPLPCQPHLFPSPAISQYLCTSPTSFGLLYSSHLQIFNPLTSISLYISLSLVFFHIFPLFATPPPPDFPS
jgi:hypothetical protein